jgi:hypothetical protein
MDLPTGFDVYLPIAIAGGIEKKVFSIVYIFLLKCVNRRRKYKVDEKNVWRFSFAYVIIRNRETLPGKWKSCPLSGVYRFSGERTRTWGVFVYF